MHTDKLKYKELTHLIIKGSYEVETQKEIAVYFREILIGNFRADMIVEGKLLLEFKAVRGLEPVHEAQLLNYLKATTTPVGLLMNFGNMPTFKRLVYNKQLKQSV